VRIADKARDEPDCPAGGGRVVWRLKRAFRTGL
jgi:hypothetical protein